MDPICPIEPVQMDFLGAPSPSPTDEGGRLRTQIRAEAITAPTPRSKPSRLDERQLALVPLNNLKLSDQGRYALLEGLLIHELRALDDQRTTPELREDLIAWVAAPKRTREALQEAPFSFQACCLAAGVDFEEMRERTLFMFAPHLVDQVD